MERVKVLLRRDGGGQFQQVGRIQSRRGKDLTLVLPDGSTLPHTLAEGELTPVEGSFMHLLRLSPTIVEATLAEQPERVYKQLMQDAGRPMTARALKDKLSDLPGTLVDKSWLRAKTALESDDDVERQGRNQNAYALTSSVAVDLLDLVPATSAQASAGSAPPLADDSVEVTLNEARTEPASEAVPPDEQPELAEPAGPATADEEPNKEQAHAVAADDLASRLSRRFPTPSVRSLEDVVRSPLATALALRSLNKAEREELFSGLVGHEALVVDLLAPVSTPSAEKDASGEDPSLIRELLKAASYELRGLVSNKQARGCFVSLVDRAAVAGASSPAAVIRGAQLLASPMKPAPEADRCLRLLADAVDTASATDLAGWDLGALARAASTLRFDHDGGRSRVVSAIFRRLPEEARRQRWWEGTDAGQLAEAARGRLGRVLEDEEVARLVVAPHVGQLVDQTSSRSGVALVWGLPSPLAVHVDGRRMARLVAEVARKDGTTDSWLKLLSNAQTVSDLEAEVSLLTRALKTAQENEVAAREQHERLSEQVRRTAEQLAAVRNADVSDRGSRDRQVRLDLLRSLAVVVAQVKQSDSARGDAALTRQLDHACRREGLTELASAGQTVAYDPAQHDSLTPDLSSGSPAAVLRGGYTWADGAENVVLVKAQVVAV